MWCLKYIQKFSLYLRMFFSSLTRLYKNNTWRYITRDIYGSCAFEIIQEFRFCGYTVNSQRPSFPGWRLRLHPGAGPCPILGFCVFDKVFAKNSLRDFPVNIYINNNDLS